MHLGHSFPCVYICVYKEGDINAFLWKEKEITFKFCWLVLFVFTCIPLFTLTCSEISNLVFLVFIGQKECKINSGDFINLLPRCLDVCTRSQNHVGRWNSRIGYNLFEGVVVNNFGSLWLLDCYVMIQKYTI